MSKTINGQIKDFKKDIDKISSNFTKELSKRAVKDLCDVHRQIVDDFYSKYDPIRYVRTHNLYNSLLPQNPVSIHSNGYSGGIVVGSFNMFDNYKISPDNVFDLFWNKGIRGLPKVSNTYPDWVNPGWQKKDENGNWMDSKYGEYENVFRTQVALGTYISKEGTPHQVMKDITEHWGEAIGVSLCDEIYKKIKQ